MRAQSVTYPPLPCAVLCVKANACALGNVGSFTLFCVLCLNDGFPSGEDQPLSAFFIDVAALVYFSPVLRRYSCVRSR